MEVTPDASIEKGRSRSIAEIAAAAMVAAVAAAAAMAAARYPVESATFPFVISVSVGLLSLWIAVRELARRRRGAGTPGSVVHHAPRLAIGACALVAYIAAVSVVGYAIASIAMCVLLPAAVGYRNWRLLIVVAVTCVVAIVAIFGYALGRPLPTGIF